MYIVPSETDKYAQEDWRPFKLDNSLFSVGRAVQNLAISVNLLALSSRLSSSTVEDRGEIVSWITLAGADAHTEDDDEGLSIFPPVLAWPGLEVQAVCPLWNTLASQPAVADWLTGSDRQ